MLSYSFPSPLSLCLFFQLCACTNNTGRTGSKDTFLQVQTFVADPHDRVNGWIGQPNFRGSYDIILTCLTTVFISTYSMLVLNIPRPKDKPTRNAGRKMLWMVLGILGPEFPLTYAAGQWSRACKSVTAFHKAEYKSWTMRHAFFADMGGFVLVTRDDVRFPLNAKQLHWLVVHKKVDFPEMSTEELWDKSKQDSFVKLVMALQVSYFVLQCVGRAAQSLSITILELNTLAIVVCSLMTSFAWLHKSADVRVAFPITSRFTIDEITSGRTSWSLTPLDFIDENGPGYSVNVQPFMKMPVIPSERPIQMIPNDRFPTDPHGSQEYLLCLATLIYTGLHLAGWNFSFPSHIERVLWRTSSLLLFGITIAFWILETMASWIRLGRWKRLYLYLTDEKKLQAFENELLLRRQTAKRERTQLPLPWEFWSITPLALLYGLGRLYMIVEAFLEFRNMRATSFLTVNWAEYWPHT